MHVVLGANGRAGGEVARALIARGAPVRVVLRRREQGEIWRALGAEVAIGGIEDVDVLAGALAGASAAFLLNPPPVSGDPFAQTERLGSALAEAARRAGLRKAVILSSIGAQHVEGTGVIATLNRFEALMTGAVPATAFLRSAYFIETWGEVAQAAAMDGVLPSFIAPAQAIPMVSTADVGRAAADLIGEDWTGARTVELSGPQDWSATDVAAAFADALGRPVAPLFVEPEHRAAVLAGEGVPAEVAQALLGMYDGIAAGLFTRVGSNEQRRGVEPLGTAVARLLPR
jgi:uncharacterized protein YbjT (DUF2867 family)